MQAIILLLLIITLRFTIEIGLLKQAATSAFLSMSPTWALGTTLAQSFWTKTAQVVPFLALVLLAYLLYKTILRYSCSGIWRCTILGCALNYILIAFHWALESNVMSVPPLLELIGKYWIPRLTYAIGFGQILLLACGQLFHEENNLCSERILITKTVAMLSACSSTVILLSGKQGPLIALVAIVGGPFFSSFPFPF